MIIGIGTDIVDIRRIEKTIARYGYKFEQRIFTLSEQQAAQKRRLSQNPRNSIASSYAKRFAAKEACAKALGTGFSNGILHRDIEVTNLLSGKPLLIFNGGALQYLLNLIPPEMSAVTHLTLTDEYPYAQAWVIIEAL